MNIKKTLLDNLYKIHTTTMGIERIRKNLNLVNYDVVAWCISKIEDPNCRIIRLGKNWYIEIDNYIITINAHSYTIITAHKINN